MVFDLENGAAVQDTVAQPSTSPAKTAKTPTKNCPPSTLEGATQEIVDFIFSKDMFNEAMSMFDIDVNKMPLGQLSSSQVQKGYAVLLELQTAVTANNRPQIEALTGRYGTEYLRCSQCTGLVTRTKIIYFRCIK